jgi:hypothetical protein
VYGPACGSVQIIEDSSVVGYDGDRNVRDEEQLVGPKEPNRKQSEEPEQSRWGFRGKTVWDFLQLLIVPLMLVAIGLVFSLQQDARQQRIEDQRAEAERELAEQRAQDEALQAYLDQMSQLMLERKLLEAEQGAPVHTLAQARTSTIILRLDAEHNESVIRFLGDSGLAASDEASVSLLREITLSHATLSNAPLGDANLSSANLSGADLSFANLSGADLSDADLIGANLSDAILVNANLSGAVMDTANLSGANLGGAKGVTKERLEQEAVSLTGATMPDFTVHD